MPQQWIWEALAMGKESALKGVDTNKFEWRGVHPDFGSPLHAILFGKIRDDTTTDSEEGTANGDGFGDLIGDDVTEKKARLTLLRLAMEKGADPDAQAPPSCDVQKFWFLEKRGQRKETKSILFAGKSVLQCLLAAERAIKMTDAADWKEDLEAIDEAMEILCTSCNQRTSQVVAEGVVDTWENALGDSEWADVVIRAEGREEDHPAEDARGLQGATAAAAGMSGSPAASPSGGGQRWQRGDADECAGSRASRNEASSSSSGGEVAVHGVVLRGASPVLRAMLSTTGMREGSRRVIEVPDCSIRSLRLMLSLVYTGTVSSSFCCEEEPCTADMLSAINLAHRWQVLHVVQMLAAALQNRVCMEDLEAIFDAAVRLQLVSLLSTCCVFVNDKWSELHERMSELRSPALRAEIERKRSRDGDLALEMALQSSMKRRRRTLQ